MKKWLAIGILGLLVLFSSFNSVSADSMLSYSNVSLSPDDTIEHSVYDTFWNYDDKTVDVEVTSDKPVDVYIMSNANYIFGGTNFAGASYKEEGVTSTSFTYEITDEQAYYLVIHNPNNESATVDYAYSDFTEEILDDVEDAIFTGLMFCLIIIVVIVVVIIVIIVVIIKLGKSKQAQQPYAPPPPGYGQQPPPPPPPQY